MFRQLSLFFSLMLMSVFASIGYAQTITALLHQSTDPVAGNAQGKITIVEFFDYQCAHCSAMAPVLKSIARSNPNVRIIFKELPIRGPISEFASRAALAANKQGKYHRFNYALLTTEKMLTQESILDIAKNIGLNIPKLQRDMHSASINKQLTNNLSLARQLNISGTPAFFVAKTSANKPDQITFVLGEMSHSELQAAIDRNSKGLA